jgi:hypothetical protein
MSNKRKTESGKWKVFFVSLLFCCLAVTGMAQKKNSNKVELTKEELANYESEITQMVKYLQETLNFIGDPSQSAQEKEIIFSESYSKIFQDDKVQIEDDLDTQRTTSINKDVQAYLKDIDFFFRYATFTFDIQSINNLYKEDGSPYFKVTTNRKLLGKTVTNDSINEVKTRYIEINLDKKNNDLKIASIYTTKVNEKESLRYWWNSMPSAWKNYFGKDIKINDTIPLKSVMQINETDFIYLYPILSVQDGDTIPVDWKETVVRKGLDKLYSQLKNLSLTQEVNVANTKTITNLDPLAELSELSTLNITGTNVNDLTPLRNANKLRTLKAGNTRIEDITPLKYDIMLEDLDISHTDVSDLSILDILNGLEKLNISYTKVYDLKPIENCPKLTHLFVEGCGINTIQAINKLEKIVSLNVSGNPIRNLSPVSHLKSLQSLKISNTSITNLNALQDMEDLRELYCSNTVIRDLTPLKNHKRLSKIYCDNTKIDIDQATEFTKENPFTLVIYNTSALEEWWNNLPLYWKAVFLKHIQIEGEPSTEQLHEVINMTDLDLSGNPYIQDLIPVNRLTNLVNLNISNTEITHLGPLMGMTNLESVNMENTYVSNLKPLADMKRLRVLNIKNTPIDNLDALVNDSHLEIILADGSDIGDKEVRSLKDAVPNVTVLYQTEELKNWWKELDETWKDIFKDQIGCNTYYPSETELQKMQDLVELNIEQESLVQTLEPVGKLHWLEKINLSNQGIRDITPLADKPHLKELLLQNNPINDLTPLENDTLLSVLNIENTQVDDLSSLEKMKHMRVLNASGTGIKSLKPLSRMNRLEELLVNNTGIKSISPIENIATLKLLKIYNTKVKSKAVNALQQKRFDLNIVYY